MSIEKLQGNMGTPSEMALIRNLHWWTVEYGLIGTLDDFKLYGAGLLSSIGEGMSCLDDSVKKIPYTLEAMHCNYDITKPQPQLFVTPNFAHLTAVLEQFKKLMAWTTGGLNGIRKAIASQHTGTIEYSSGLQVTGTFTNVIESEGHPIFIQTSGPTALSTNNVQLHKYDKERFPDGFSSPVGKLSGSMLPLENMSDDELTEVGVERNKHAILNFERGMTIEGIVKDIVRGSSQKVIILELHNATVRHQEKVILVAASYAMAVGEKIVSAFAGPADVEAFQPTVMVPHEKMHKIHYDAKAIQLHELYGKVRQARDSKNLISELPALWKRAVAEYPDDWLLSLEILEILQPMTSHQECFNKILEYLETKKLSNPHLDKLITNGLKLLKLDKTSVR